MPDLPATIPDMPDNGVTASKLARNVTIAQDYMIGMGIDALEAKYSLSKRHIYRILSTDEAVREIITGAVKHNIAGLYTAVDEHDKMIADPETDKAVKLRAIDLRYKVTGVAASHTPNPIIQNVYIDNSVTVGDESKPLKEYAKFKLSVKPWDGDDDVVDGEVDGG